MGFYNRYIPAAKQQSSLRAPADAAPKALNKRQIPSEGPAKRLKKTSNIDENRAKEDPNVEASHIVAGEQDDEEVKHRKIKEKFKKATEVGSQKSVTNGHVSEVAAEVPIQKHGLEPLPQPYDAEESKPVLSNPLPSWISNAVRVDPEHRIPIGDLPLSKQMKQKLHDKDYSSAFAIQAAVIPLLLQGGHKGDVCVSAATGSGKTLSYVLPMVEALRDKNETRLRGLIVVPTRELVNQVRETIEVCAAGSGLQIGIAVGNRTMAEEREALMERDEEYDFNEYTRRQRRHTSPTVEEIMDWDRDISDDETSNIPGYVAVWVPSVDILICTPGRLVDHMRSTKGFTLKHVQWLVVDEADRLLDLSFQQWVETVMPALKWMPAPDQESKDFQDLYGIRPPERYVKKVILSATMTRDINKLMSLELVRPKLIILAAEKAEQEGLEEPAQYELPSMLSEVAVTLGRNDEKPLTLVQLLTEMMKAEPSGTPTQAAPIFALRQDHRTGPSSLASSSPSSSDADSDSDTSSASSDQQSSTSRGDTESTSSSGSDTEQTELGADDNTRNSQTHGFLVFVNTNEAAVRLARLLSLLRPAWGPLVGTLSRSTATSSGRRILAAFRGRKLSILVASDRASRGLDIKNLTAVINYDMPQSLKSYIHRVGRTARAGRRGTALTLVAYHEGRWFWNEIGRSNLVQRQSTKVTRREGTGKLVSDELKESYQTALSRLGEEATGQN